MGHQQNVIELNGHHYDALSGRLLQSQKHAATPAATHPKTHAPKTHTRQVVDGFTVRPQHKHAAKAHSPAATSHAVHSKTERSKTLMRHAVKKPAHTPKAAHHDKPAAADIRASASVNPSRIRRASDVRKSHLISRFGAMRPGVEKKVASLAVKPAPAEHALHTVSTPIDAADIALPPEIAMAPDMFDEALRNATGHEQPKAKKQSLRHRAAKKLRVSPRTFNISAGIIAMLLVGGFIAYRNIPQLAVKVAATRAGVRAHLPAYQPSGFSLTGPVQYSSGQITLNYQSNSDDRAFRVVQKSSDWNSQALLENFVTAGDRTYQTLQEKGRTVYMYDGSNATWVSGGVWYQIEAEEALNSDQLLRVVTSL